PHSVSHRILPEYREYERTSTVVINAYLAPRVGHYLKELTNGLKRSGARHPALRVMQSSGGSISAEIAAREPVRTILSGPAGGVVAATKVAGLIGGRDIITFDMGGTSTDVALCKGEAKTTNEAQITGLPVAVPVLDIHTVGAGGGSIAYVDAGGALRVGPESAGADPGPACYGRGTRATVTDANLVLGRFGGAGLLGGAMRLDEARARAALGVIRVVNANMEQALRLVSVERGHDPRRFALVSFGGAGGLHAAALAGALRIPKVIVPATPGAFSALGVLLAEVVRDYSQTVMLTVTDAEMAKQEEGVSRLFAGLEREAVRELKAEGMATSQIRLVRSLAMRYTGQSFELEVRCPEKLDHKVLVAFHRIHQERYGHCDPTRAVQIVSIRLRGVGIAGKSPLRQEQRIKSQPAKPQSETVMRFGSKPTRIPVYDRQQLGPGAALSGPALITEYGSTTLVPAEWQAVPDGWRNLILTAAG